MPHYSFKNKNKIKNIKMDLKVPNEITIPKCVVFKSDVLISELDVKQQPWQHDIQDREIRSSNIMYIFF